MEAVKFAVRYTLISRCSSAIGFGCFLSVWFGLRGGACESSRPKRRYWYSRGHYILCPHVARRIATPLDMPRNGPYFIFSSRRLSASAASALACLEADGNPPKAASIPCAVILLNSLTFFPSIICVNHEPQATAGTQPAVFNFTSDTLSSRIRTQSFIKSPQTGFVTSTTAVG